VSISRKYGRSLLAGVTVLGLQVGFTLPAMGAQVPCTQALGLPAATAGPLRTLGVEPALAALSVVAGHSYLVEVTERDNDSLVEVLDAQDRVLARVDHPERRTGTRRALVTSPATLLRVRVTGKERAGIAGTASISAFDLASATAPAGCIAAYRALARADADYAEGEKLAHGAQASHSPDARAAFARAAAGFTEAAQALMAPEDRELRGQAALAVAATDYSNLQDWSHAAEWAETAAVAFGRLDPYRRARAQALRATAWIEIGSPALLRRSGEALQSVSQFHLRRGERYDAGLQTTNLSMVYAYQGRYPECIAASQSAARLFGSIQETQRRVQAWQNQATCLWGEGRLSEALSQFQQARREVVPGEIPGLYLAVTNNTALLSYALGHFDEALSLFDRALAFAQQVHDSRNEGQSLYGIGVTYYAIGDRDRARQFLERALTIRTAAFDSRGRMATLRALANVDAEQGRLEQALSFDAEALRLAVAPSALARIRIQTAVHTAQAGRLEEALAQLSQVVADRNTDSLIRAEAQLQRAVVLRELERPAEARADLTAARPLLHTRGSATEEFQGDLELSRVLRIVGKPQEALKALDEALTHADAVREQTANPELRMQLGTPLRAAYELKVELLRARFETARSAGKSAEAAALATAGFLAADSSRAHSLADFAAQEYLPEVRTALAGDLGRRAELYRQMAARRFTLESRLDRAGSEDPQARRLIADIADLERQADAVNTVIARGALAANADGNPHTQSHGVPRLPENAALAAYWLGTESAYVWVILPGSIEWMRLPATTAIEDAAAKFHHSLTRLVDVPVERRLQDAQQLYQMIIEPVARVLAPAQLWVVIPDRALTYVPFAALRTADLGTGAFVAMRHDIAIAPAAWLMAHEGRRASTPSTRKMLLIDDPVYQSDDPRLKALKAHAAQPDAAEIAIANAPYHELRRLPFTAEEARRILAEFSPAQVEELTGLQATRERALALDWSGYRYIHIAAHAIADSQVPQLSAVILGAYNAQGEAVEQAVRVSDLSLETLTADVAVLSACDTAVGPQVASEGPVGLESTLLARGARAVVASLWPVSDEMSAQLMTDFYRHLVQESMSAPAALGGAMRTVMSRERSSDPALWATFQVSVTALGTAGRPDEPQH
jgi:CHAT domain-containing protein